MNKFPSAVRHSPRKRMGHIFTGLSRYSIIISGLVIIILLLFEYPVTAIGLGVVAFTFIQYVESLGNKIAIKEMIVLIASLQWILGPYIDYKLGSIHYKYFMYVSEERYMGFIVPAMISFIAGMYLFRSRYSFIYILNNFRHSLHVSKNHVYYLIIISLLSGIVSPYVPFSLSFILYFFIQLKYIGALYLLMVRDRNRWLILFFIMSLTLAGALEAGFFHNFILWSAFIFSYLCIEYKLKRMTKYLALIFGMVAIISIQSIKADYRKEVGGYSGIKIGLFSRMIAGLPTSDQKITLNKRVSNLNVRLNQGWIISAVLSEVPRRVEFAKGKTIIDALVAALVPRFLFDKKIVHVRDNFIKYTGTYIGKHTSMGISIPGEAYVNFGNVFGALFMIAWGAFISLIIKFIMDNSVRNPSLFLWTPLIFLQVVKAETELIVVFNHAVKSLVFIFIFYWGAKRILRWKI